MNVVLAAQNIVDLSHRARIKRAIVTGNNSNEVYVKDVGYATAYAQSFAKLSGVVVVPGDVVLMLDVTGTGGWIILGPIVSNGI